MLVRCELGSTSQGYWYNWIIDHDASWALWRERQGNHLSPPYGLWRRVDSCVLDALVCWPEVDLTGPRPGRIHAHAGWTNGVWTSSLRRRVGHHGLREGECKKPYIERLDAVAPAWRFVDVSDMHGGADVAGVEEISAGQYLLPSDLPLSGFQSSMPHLISADGRSAIFPAGYRIHGHHDGADSWFLYVDADVFFHIAAHAGPLFWEFKWGLAGSLACIGLRHRDRFASGQPGGLPSDLFTHHESRYGSSVLLTPIPAPALAHRVITALLDAGLLWRRETGSVCEIPERIPWRRPFPTELEYGQTAKITKSKKIWVKGGYIGGIFDRTLTTTAMLDDA